MPPLDNPKYEIFAQNIAKGKLPADAYEAAGFKRHEGNASRLRHSEKVSARVRELMAEIAARVVTEAVYDRQAAMREAEAARLMAMESGQPRAAVSAVELKAKLFGVLIEKKEVGGVGDFERLTDDELRHSIARELGSGRTPAARANGSGTTH